MVLFCLLGLCRLLGAAADASAAEAPTGPVSRDANDSPTNGLGSWIWAAKVLDRQTCQLWKVFEIPPETQVSHARLVMTADNEFRLYLDGRELGRGAEWRELFDYDVTQLLSPGTHTVAVKAYNSSTFAGMIFGLSIDLADGRELAVRSDQSWRIVPEGTKDWQTKTRAPDSWPLAAVLAPLGGNPWWTTPQNINLMPALTPLKVWFWQTGWFQISLLSLLSVVLLISLRLVAQLALHRKEQWLLRQERARIARDIHDDLGSRMTQLVLHGEVVQSELPADSDTRAQIRQICEEARGMLSTLDEILWAVNPKRDTFRDFTSYICGFAQEFFKNTRIQCLFDLDPAAASVVLGLPLKRALFMAVKETLNNTLKHAQATEVRLQIRWQTGRLLVVITDNGKGFDPTSSKPGRNGLANLSQRMHEFEGACVVTSRPGHGCRTELSIPLKQPRRLLRDWLGRWSTPGEARTSGAEVNSMIQAHDPPKC